MAREYEFARFRTVFMWTYRTIMKHQWCWKVVFASWKMEEVHMCSKDSDRLMLGVILPNIRNPSGLSYPSLSLLEIRMKSLLVGISYSRSSTLLMTLLGAIFGRIRRSCTSSKQHPILMRTKIQRYQCWEVVDLDLFEMPIDPWWFMLKFMEYTEYDMDLYKVVTSAN